MPLSEITKKKREIVKSIEELQRLYEEDHGDFCQISINLGYTTTTKLSDTCNCETILTDIHIHCSINV